MLKFSSVRLSGALLLSLSVVTMPAWADEESVCTAPGVTLLTDAGGDVQPGVAMGLVPLSLPLDFADLLSLQVAQPVQEDGVARLVFTINVASLEMLSTLPPSSIWYTSFKSAGGYFGVRMITSQSGEASFESYAVEAGGLQGDGVSDGRFAVDGSEKAADASSNFTDGAITIVVPAKDVGVVRSGDTLSQFNAAEVLQVVVPAAVTFADTLDQMPDDLGRRGSVTLPMADTCLDAPKSLNSKSLNSSQFGGVFGLGLLLPLLAFAAFRRRG